MISRTDGKTSDDQPRNSETTVEPATAAPRSGLLQRKMRDRAIQRRARGGSDEASAVAPAPTGGGSALPDDVRGSMERSFGADFSSVRVHQGGPADRMGAVAYAQGNDLHFSPGAYDPASHGGRELLGHELAHVVQQRAGRVAEPQGKGAPINADAGLEAEADAAGARAAKGEPAGIAGGTSGGSSSTGPIQRFVRRGADANFGGLGKAMKVSDDGKMAVQDIALYPEGQGRAHQEFYAAADVVGDAKGKLGELQSAYDIETGPALPTAQTGGITLNRVIASNKVLGDQGHGNATPLNCDDNTRQFMGVNTMTEQDRGTNQIRATLTEREKRFLRSDVDHQRDVDATPTESFDKAKGRATELMTGKTGRDQANPAYARMSERKKNEKAAIVGVNQHAHAGVGGAYGVFGKSGRHFAPILAVSGDDQVALEAHVHSHTTEGPARDEIAPGDRDNYNPEWYFQMYGPVKTDQRGRVTEDQTFYGRHKEQFPDDNELMVVAFAKLDEAKNLNSTPGGKQRLVRHVVDGANRIATSTVEKLNIVKYAEVQPQIAAAMLPLRKDPQTIPQDVTQLAGFLTTWESAIEQAALPQEIVGGLRASLEGKVRATVREIRRCKTLIA